MKTILHGVAVVVLAILGFIVVIATILGETNNPRLVKKSKELSVPFGYLYLLLTALVLAGA